MQRNLCAKIKTLRKKIIPKTYPELEYSQSFPVLEKTITATSASQRIASSRAFLSSPFRLLENVTCLLFAFSILFISILPLPITNHTHKRKNIYMIEFENEAEEKGAFFRGKLNWEGERERREEMILKERETARTFLQQMARELGKGMSRVYFAWFCCVVDFKRWSMTWPVHASLLCHIWGSLPFFFPFFSFRFIINSI